MNREQIATSPPDVISKHAQLATEIRNIDSITRHLCDLIDRIQGALPESTKGEQIERTEPSLAEVLADSPPIIRAKIDSIHRLIDQITDLLF